MTQFKKKVKTRMYRLCAEIFAEQVNSGAKNQVQAGDEPAQKKRKYDPVDDFMSCFESAPLEVEDIDILDVDDKDKILKQVQQYFQVTKAMPTSDPIAWWKANQRTFDLMAPAARRVLAVPATAADVERLWSASGRVLSKARAARTPKHAEMVIMLRRNKWFVHA